MVGSLKLGVNTRRDYRVTIQNHIVPRIDTVRLQELSRLQVRASNEELQREGKIRKRKDKATGEIVIMARESFSKKTVQNVHICLGRP